MVFLVVFSKTPCVILMFWKLVPTFERNRQECEHTSKISEVNRQQRARRVDIDEEFCEFLQQCVGDGVGAAHQCAKIYALIL